HVLARKGGGRKGQPVKHLTTQYLECQQHLSVIHSLYDKSRTFVLSMYIFPAYIFHFRFAFRDMYSAARSFSCSPIRFASRNLPFCFVRERKYGGSIRSTRDSMSCVAAGAKEYQLKWSQSCPRVLLRLAPSSRLRMLPLPT